MARDVRVRFSVHRRLLVGAVAVSFAASGMAACGSSTASARPARSVAKATPVPQPPAGFAPFDPANFDASSIDVTNRYLPLQPGRRYLYEGSTRDGDKTVSHREEFTVTDLVKEVDGVQTLIVADKDFSPDGLEESELTFFAQDRTGAVWHFGQYREEYDGKEFVGGQAWLAGHLPGARPGIFMLADPQVGTPSYSEGYAPPPFYWDDDAVVAAAHQHVAVRAGRYDDVLVVREFNAEEPGAQLKYYAPGVGFVRVGWEGRDTQHETLELAAVTQLDAGGLADARADALALDLRAGLYGRTPGVRTRSAPAG